MRLTARSRRVEKSPHTAGAAEVLAAALAQDRGIPTIGQRTFGSASEQKDIPLEDGGALILTVALYHDPAGKSINEGGVKASVEVAQSDDDSTETPDEAAPEGQAHPLTPGTPRTSNDPALRKALEILRNQGQPAAAAGRAAA